MMRSLMSGVSGLRNHQTKLDVIGNNIANINTIGFKGNRVTFADQISQLIRVGRGTRENYGSVNPMSVGLGMSIQSIDTIQSQGALESTGFATDLAIQGKGYFVIRHGDDSFYTRAGNFSLDENGKLITGDGGFVQGWIADNLGNITTDSALEDMEIPLQMKIPAHATDNVVFYSNLDATGTTAAARLTEPGNSNVTSITGTASDGVGGTHSISITGQQATNSTGTGALTGMNFNDTLESLGVLDTEGFSVSVDTGTDVQENYIISGLTLQSTVGELINALNEQVNGVRFDLTEGGSVQVTREYAGIGTQYNVRIQDTEDSDLAQRIFGGTEFDVNNGTASTLQAVDTFTDSSGNPAVATALEFIADHTSGLMTEIRGVGGSGVTVLSGEGFSATDGSPLIVNTEDTSHSTSITIYDHQGETHNLYMTFTKTSMANTWVWEADVSSPATVISGSTGQVSFNNDGSLATFSFDNNATAFRFSPRVGTDDVAVTFDPGMVGTFSGLSQTAAPFTTAAIKQNGYGLGELENVLIDENGLILGNFTNGVDQTLGQVVVADFANNQGLERAGNNLWRETVASGIPIMGESNVNFNSKVQAGYLEMSNVDLVKEFTEMITAQRGFQANARVVTVSDQVLTEATQLKR